MKKVKVLTAQEAVDLVKDGDTLVTSGFVGNCNPELLSKTIEKKFLETGHPRDLTLFYISSQGDRSGTRGGDHYAHEGMLKRAVLAHYGTAPSLGKMAVENKMEAFNIPQGGTVFMIRDMAGKRPGTITHVGLDTFVDPRNTGGKVNQKAIDSGWNPIQLIEVDGEEKLFYRTFPVNICFIRGTYADEFGNVSLDKEAATTEVLSIAQAVYNNKGTVIVQVEGIVKAGTINPKLVKIPGAYVTAVVVASPEDHEQALGQPYNPGISGEQRMVVGETAPMPLNAKKILARRAAMELREGTVVNLGVGAPEGIAAVAGEEGISDYMTLTVESGTIGGIPQGGSRFGSALNPDAIIDQGYQFDFYDGGGLDQAYLGLAQCDQFGNINVSRFGPRLAGCGGFISITQNAGKVFFLGTFTAGGLKTSIVDGKLVIDQEGREIKFIENVEQVTFSGKRANKNKQPVLYITERCVFELTEKGLCLIEVAPGIDIQTQILDLMKFKPEISENLKEMDPRLFQVEKMGLAK